MLDFILAQELKCSDFKVPFEEHPVFEQRHWIAVHKQIASSGGNTVGVYRWYGKSPEGRPRGFQSKFLEDSTHTKKRGSLIWKGEGF